MTSHAQNFNNGTSSTPHQPLAAQPRLPQQALQFVPQQAPQLAPQQAPQQSPQPAAPKKGKKRNAGRATGSKNFGEDEINGMLLCKICSAAVFVYCTVCCAV